MRAFRIVLIVLIDIVFIGAFIFFLPELVRLFDNQLTALLVAGIMVIGGGIVIGLAFLKSRRSAKMNGGRLSRHM